MPKTEKLIDFFFNVICGESTGSYSFKTGFYGLTDVRTEFEKAIDYTLVELEN